MVVWMVLMAGHHFLSQNDTCTQLRHGIALLNAIRSEGPSCMSSSVKRTVAIQDDLLGMLYFIAWSLT